MTIVTGSDLGDPLPAKAEYFRPEIDKDANENAGMTVIRERVVVSGTCLDQLRSLVLSSSRDLLTRCFGDSGMKGTTVEATARRETARVQVTLDEASRALVESKRQLMAQNAQVAMWLDGRDGPRFCAS